MKRRNLHFSIIFLLTVHLTGTSAAAASLERLYAYSEPRLVALCAGPDAKVVGTGFFVSDHGDILSADHIIEEHAGTGNLCAIFSAEANAAKGIHGVKVVARDSSRDLVHLKLKDSSIRTPLIRPPSKDSAIAPGNKIAFSGFPHGPLLTVSRPTMHTGIISSIKMAGKNPLQKNPQKLYQIDGTGTQGFSGAPLFLAATGEVIGIMSSYLEEDKSITFAVPIEHADELLKKSIKKTEISAHVTTTLAPPTGYSRDSLRMIADQRLLQHTSSTQNRRQTS